MRPMTRRLSRAISGPAIVLSAVATVAVIAVLFGVIRGVVTGGESSATSTTTPTTTAAVSGTTGAEIGAAFTACMRAHGVPAFPDVTLSSDGLVNLDIKGERVDGSSRIYGAAVHACEPLLPAGARLPGAPSAPRAPSAPEIKGR